MKRNNLYLGLVTPSSGWWSPIGLNNTNLKIWWNDRQKNPVIAGLVPWLFLCNAIDCCATWSQDYFDIFILWKMAFTLMTFRLKHFVQCHSLLICRYGIQHNNTQHNDIKHKGLFVIPTILAFKINEIQHKHHYPECHYAECCILFMAMQSVGRLNVVCYSLLICRYSIQHNNTQHNDIKHKGLFVIPTILAFKIN